MHSVIEMLVKLIVICSVPMEVVIISSDCFSATENMPTAQPQYIKSSTSESYFFLEKADTFIT